MIGLPNESNLSEVTPKKLCKEKLKALGIERLADLLFEIADKDAAVEKRLLIATASDSERLANVRSQISGLKRPKEFYDWRSIRKLAEKIEILIEAISRLKMPAKKGFQLVVSFYETDDAVYGNCDDSSGVIGDLIINSRSRPSITRVHQSDSPISSASFSSTSSTLR